MNKLLEITVGYILLGVLIAGATYSLLIKKSDAVPKETDTHTIPTIYVGRIKNIYVYKFTDNGNEFCYLAMHEYNSTTPTISCFKK